MLKKKKTNGPEGRKREIAYGWGCLRGAPAVSTSPARAVDPNGHR